MQNRMIAVPVHRPRISVSLARNGFGGTNITSTYRQGSKYRCCTPSSPYAPIGVQMMYIDNKVAARTPSAVMIHTVLMINLAARGRFDAAPGSGFALFSADEAEDSGLPLHVQIIAMMMNRAASAIVPGIRAFPDRKPQMSPG